MGNLYDTIISLCESRGIKGGKMCTDLGISKGLMTDLKMGRRTGISAVTAQKIAAYFGVSVGYILGGEEKGEKKEQPIEIDELSKRQKYFIERIKKMSDSELDRLERILALVEKE
jgi:transcriptional regulator with XRE-family HTH domain